MAGLYHSRTFFLKSSLKNQIQKLWKQQCKQNLQPALTLTSAQALVYVKSMATCKPNKTEKQTVIRSFYMTYFTI